MTITISPELGQEARDQLDTVIRKSRVHLYKPIQIAEILHQHRLGNLRDLSDLESYRSRSKGWRDSVSERLLGRSCTSSARFQDDLFNESAIPPRLIAELGKLNKATDGGVEEYIYSRLAARHEGMSSALTYVDGKEPANFSLSDFLGHFRNDPGMRRSVDKAFEIVIYCLIAAVLEHLEAKISVTLNESRWNELQDFSGLLNVVIGLDSATGQPIEHLARIYRAGTTNAADRGLDMWANFGPAIQVKHLDLSEALAGEIIGSVAADRVVIVCRSAEARVVKAVLGQAGFGHRVQGVLTEEDLDRAYDFALRGSASEVIGLSLLKLIKEELALEFPSAGNDGLKVFAQERGYRLDVVFPCYDVIVELPPVTA